MALLRLNIPGLVLYSGSIMAGEYEGRKLTIQDVFESVGAFYSGQITPEQLHGIESHACP
jgi:dihydroxy-acid dehydratase